MKPLNPTPFLSRLLPFLLERDEEAVFTVRLVVRARGEGKLAFDKTQFLRIQLLRSLTAFPTTRYQFSGYNFHRRRQREPSFVKPRNTNLAAENAENAKRHELTRMAADELRQTTARRHSELGTRNF